jgi:peptidoglycan/xylan/chitin deacetylase (PgdA/CDA1 family)
LMEIEEKSGFRSSFNFVPADYQVAPKLLGKLTVNGFEVGVHGWTHDGSLYKSREIFLEQARGINERLREWGAVGFRSPAMHHNLDWLRDLDIEYDLSTFDTDPFEPQSDGVGTIFPFRVEGRGSRKGYMEMPYTLVQDFTLFILLREKTADVWKRKLDWIADSGGMALLNTHPDYMNFNGTKCGREEYPCGYYEEFLDYVKARYEGEYWHALPRDVARYCSDNGVGSGIDPARKLIAPAQ